MRKSNHTILAATLLVAVTLAASAAELNVRDFGAIPDDGKDDTMAVNKAVAEAKEGDTIRFDGGTYYFDNPEVHHFGLHGYKHLPGYPKTYSKGLKGFIDVTGKKGIRLLGAVDEDEKPATVLMRHNALKIGGYPPSQINILHSEDIAVENLKIDMDQRFTIVWEIVETGHDYMIGHVPEGYPLVEGIDYLRGGLRPSESLDSGYGINSRGKRVQFDGKLKGPWKTIDKEKRLQKVAVDVKKKGIESGDVVYAAFSHTDGAYNLQAGCSTKVTLRNLWFDNAALTGMRFYAVRGVEVDGVYFSPEAGFLCPTSRDAFYWFEGGGNIRINRCYVYGGGDDAQNTAKASCLVRKIKDKRTILYSTSAIGALDVYELPAPMYWNDPATGERAFAGNCVRITPQDQPPPEGPGWSLGNHNSKLPVGELEMDRDLPDGLVEFDPKTAMAAAYLWFQEPDPNAKFEYTNCSYDYPAGNAGFSHPRSARVRNLLVTHGSCGGGSALWWPADNIPVHGDFEYRDSVLLNSDFHIRIGGPQSEIEPIKTSDVNLRGCVFIKSPITGTGAFRNDRKYGWRDSVIENCGFDNKNIFAGLKLEDAPKHGFILRDNYEAKLLMHEPFIRSKYSEKFDVEWRPASGEWVFDGDCHKFYKQIDESDSPEISLAGEQSWKNYFVKVNARRIADKGTIGVIAAARDGKNHLLFEMDGQKARIVRVGDGERQTLAEAPFASPAGAWHNLKLDLSGGKFVGYIDSDPVAEVAASGATAGRIGLFSQANRAKFDDVIVVQKISLR